jgi:hypothetical protein
MNDETRRIIRLTFAVVGALAALLGIGTEFEFTVFRLVYSPPGDLSYGVRSGLLYLALAAVSFYAVWRLKAPSVDDTNGIVGPGFHTNVPTRDFMFPAQLFVALAANAVLVSACLKKNDGWLNIAALFYVGPLLNAALLVIFWLILLVQHTLRPRRRLMLRFAACTLIPLICYAGDALLIFSHGFSS